MQRVPMHQVMAIQAPAVLLIMVECFTDLNVHIRQLSPFRVGLDIIMTLAARENIVSEWWRFNRICLGGVRQARICSMCCRSHVTIILIQP